MSVTKPKILVSSLVFGFMIAVEAGVCERQMRRQADLLNACQVTAEGVPQFTWRKVTGRRLITPSLVTQAGRAQRHLCSNETLLTLQAVNCVSAKLQPLI